MVTYAHVLLAKCKWVMSADVVWRRKDQIGKAILLFTAAWLVRVGIRLQKLDYSADLNNPATNEYKHIFAHVYSKVRL